ncbi:hypothetical protein [Aurantiacibacter marinus]|uniref:Uncharacterized protein n=1 Tax=Aurantiacibacter marinus TaxID=874156 RepID=A0A0H0XLF8_9SPHN|nr:hypothetical protein [Aurantiacibacter marinus]KLI62811.1 hypothetical protein AAV99_12010 [Aurantiacibacter marinus]
MFGQILAEKLPGHSILLTDTAPVIAEFAISARDAGGGLADPAASTGDTVAWESRPRNRGRFDNCEAQRLRATLLLVSRVDGSVVYRGVGESETCAAGGQEMADLADILISDAHGALSAD